MPRIHRRPTPRSARVVCALLLGACAGGGDPAGLAPGTARAARAALGVRAEIQATTATAVELRIGYLRADGSRVELATQTVSLGDANTQRATVSFELTRCLADPERLVPGPSCTVALELRLLRTTTQLDQETITVPVRPGDAVTVTAPVPLLEVQTIRVTPSGGGSGSPGTPGTAGVEAGDTLRLTATALDATGAAVAGRAIAWTSSAPTVATVNDQGLVTAVGPGTTTVQASGGGRTTAVTVVVSVPAVRTLTVAPAALQLAAGTSSPLAVTVRDARGNALQGRPLTFTTSDPGVATVTASGVVQGVAIGSATITATSAEGPNGTTVTATLAVTVTPAPVASLAATPSSLRLTVGTGAQLTVTALDAGLTPLPNRPVAFSTSNAAVATVSAAGAVQAVGVGSATITAASTEGAGGATVTTTVPVTVTAPVVASIAVTPAALTLAPGAQATLSVVARDPQGNVVAGRTFAFSSSNPAVATVTAAGVVRGVAAGTAGIVVSTVDPTSGATVSASATVTVPAAAVASLVASPTSLQLTVGGSLTFVVTAADAQGNPLPGRAVSVASSNLAVAGAAVTVQPQGATVVTVTGIGAGSATVTATSNEGPNGTPVRVDVPVNVIGGGPTGTTSGRLYLQSTGGGAAGVQLFFAGNGTRTFSTQSNSDGGWTSPALPPGTYTITVNSAPSLQSTQVALVPVTANANTVVPAIPLGPGATTGTLRGVIRDAVTGQPIPVPVAVTVYAGIALSSADVDRLGGGTTTVPPGGSLSVPISGTVTVRARAAGYVDAITYAATTAGQPTALSLALAPTSSTAGTRVVLTWGSAPPDLDSWLQVPAASAPILVRWDAPGSCVAFPFSCLDVDDTDGFGPETITITQRLEGTYRYWVHDYDEETGVGPSGARVQIIVNNASAGTFSAPTGNGVWWHVFDIVGGQIVPVNVYDDGPDRGRSGFVLLGGAAPRVKTAVPPKPSASPTRKQ